MVSLLTSWSLAFLLGLRHATEPDHVAAVATLVPEQRNARRAMQLGAAWGLGHSLAIVACGGALLMFRQSMSERTSDWLELTVAALLLVLGTRSILRALRKPIEPVEIEARDTDHLHELSRHCRRKSLLIGLLHGTAGSGSLAALVFANMPDLRAGFAYMVFFGAGSLLGMAALAGIAGAPLRAISQRAKPQALLFAAAGVLSFSIGIHYGLPIAQRLFGA
jgi:ABC-type nickel/cobalt efflux system permease component RcnA